MEIRKVIIVESGGQRKKVVETGAETLGQLKEDLRRHNIDFEGKTFFEGLSKTELMQDDSLLPRDIPRNGSTTNNLIFMLTVPQKKIASGSMNRQEAYAKIKELGLQDTCIKKYGRNFTMCKTDDLISLINGAATPKKEEPKPVIQEPVADTPVNKVEETPEKKAIKTLVDMLYNNGILDGEEVDDVLSVLGWEDTDNLEDSPYSEEEIDDILADLV